MLLHRICHSAIHARYSEAELARRLSTVEALRADPALADFLAWISGKPDGVHAPTRQRAGGASHRYKARSRDR